MEHEDKQAVYAAIREDDIEKFEQLLNTHKLPIDGEPDHFNDPFLFSALSTKKNRIVTWLLEQGASFSGGQFGRSRNWPALYTALSNGNLEAAKHLISFGASFEEIKDTENAIKYIVSEQVRRHNLDMMKYLFDLGVDIKLYEQKYGSLLTTAINNGEDDEADKQFIFFLVEHGADVNEQTSKYQEPPLIETLIQDRPVLFEYLLELGADPELAGGKDGSILFTMTAHSQPGKAQIKRMLDRGVDIETKDDQGMTALFIAAQTNNPAAVEALVALGANINARDDEGATPLLLASKNEWCKKAAIKLIELDADVDLKNHDGVSTYDYCEKLRKQKGNVRLIKLIESHSKQHDPEDNSVPLDLDKNEPWADKARVDIESMPEPQQTLWRELINHAAIGSSSKPTKAWSKKIAELANKLGEKHIEEILFPWLELLKENRTGNVEYGEYSDNWYCNSEMLIATYNTQVLRGLMWMLGGFTSPLIPGVLRNIAQMMYKKVYNVGMRNAKIANAALYALSQLPGDDGVKEILILRAQTKYNPALVNINRVFERVAKERNVSPEELDELAVSDYNLSDIGIYQQQLGHFIAHLEVTAVGSTQLSWSKDGKTQKSVPAEVKREHAGDLKSIKALAKDLDKASMAFRNRLEAVYLAPKKWNVDTWCERYIDHLLGGFIGRRLIWKFIGQGDPQSGIWFDGNFVNNKNETINLDGVKEVRLWHPIDSDEHAILAWRTWLAEHLISQPIRQAHREIYLLTEAERQTGDHSLRFASHILKQHQFNALARDRGWSQTLGGSWDGGNETGAYRDIPQTSYSIEFQTTPFDEYAITPNGIYNYVTTGQVVINDKDSWDPLPLESVSPLVFSELMRDIDLFVSVSSVGNDPEWELRAENPYWDDFSFGDLSNLASTRKQVLESIITKLKISNKLHIEGRFLVVKGKLRTYKIHLGSANVIMEPDSAYLCIVGTRKKASDIFLPFEGDPKLTLILSKAFMLANDYKIKDETILSQINRDA